MDFGSIGVQAANTTSQLKKPRYDNASSEQAFFSIDDALDYAGDNSRFQKRVNYIFSFQYAIYSFLMMGFPLLLVKPTFYCPSADGLGVEVCLEKDFCRAREANPSCVGPNCPSVHDNGETTIATDYQLYCEKSYLTGILGSVLFFGSFLAFFFFPYIGNSKGRKFGILVANIISAVSALAVAFAPNIEFMMVFLILGGFAFSGFEILIFVYTSEVSGERFRNYSTVTLGTVWAVAQIITSPLFLISRGWDFIFIWYMAVPWFISLWPNFTMVFETPRFLNQKRRFVKAREIINKICAINLRQPFRAKLYGEMEEENARMTTFFPPKQPRISEQPRPTTSSSTKTNQQQSTASGYMDLFRYARIRRISLALLYIWFFRNFTYFGLNYSLPVLGTEVYQNFTLTAFSETLANMYAAKFKFGIGRIQSLNYSILIVTFSCLFSYFLPIPEECLLEQSQCYQKTLLVIIAVVAKFGIGLFANILITYTSECYPTDIRALGLGLNLTISRLGTIAMPYIVTIMQDNYVSPLVLMGAMGLVAFVVIKFFLVETLNETMMDTLVEMQALNAPLLRNQDANPQ